VSGTCHECSATNIGVCGTGSFPPFCDPTSDTCVACLANYGTGAFGACTDAKTPFCNGGTCPACDAQSGHVCAPAPGSLNSPVCASPGDGLDGACVQCDSADSTPCTGIPPTCPLVVNGGVDHCVSCPLAAGSAPTCSGATPACLSTDVDTSG